MRHLSEKEIWVFLSHSHKDFEKVRKVRNLLEEQGLRPIMFFLKCLSDYDEIDGLVKREIDCRTRFILCDSENARKSEWVKREIDYIKELKKPYDRIDISKPDEEILIKLREIRRKSKLFISYTRKDHELANHIYNRLSKYDYDVFIDYYNLTGNKSLTEELHEGLKRTVENGYIIALLTENGIQSEWVNKEIELARKYDESHGMSKSSIIPIIIGDAVPDLYSDLNCLVFSPQTKDLPDIIVDSIITDLLSPGEIFTYYNNFKRGINHNVDLFEAERLGKMYYGSTRKIDRPNTSTLANKLYKYFKNLFQIHKND